MSSIVLLDGLAARADSWLVSVRLPSPAATPSCPHRRVLEDPRENPMVRHEAAEALGAIAEPECLELLKQVGVGPRPGCFT